MKKKKTKEEKKRKEEEKKQREEEQIDKEIKLYTDHRTGELYIYDNWNVIYYYKSPSGIGWGDNEEPYKIFLNKLKLKRKEKNERERQEYFIWLKNKPE